MMIQVSTACMQDAVIRSPTIHPIVDAPQIKNGGFVTIDEEHVVCSAIESGAQPVQTSVR